MAAIVRRAQLREDLATFRGGARRGAYPSALRERAVAHAAERARGGATPSEIAAELGVREVTARRWLGMADAAAAPTTAAAAEGRAVSLIPLVIGGRRVDPSCPRIRIDLPDGTRVHASGLAVSEVVEAIQALRSGR